MRPKVLTMRAFGPYGGSQVIDFTLLEDINMFLIHGPTGSGKTTILDAICYALYGQTNGGERTAESMRSKFATTDEPAEVTLTFYLKGDEYKVIRTPKFERPKKRGEGFTVEEGKALLYKLEEDEFKLVAARLQEVDRKIEELLVFNVDQFRQVIMIAQNKFRELLTADSKERQKILQDIFETGIYQSVEKQLEEKNNALIEAMKEKNMAYEMLLSRLKEEKDERLISYLQTKLLNNTPEVSEILHDLIKEYRIYEEANKARTIELKTELEKAQNVLIQQNEKHSAYMQLQEVKEKLNRFVLEEASYRQLEQEVKSLQKLQPILVVEEQWHKAQEEEKQNIQAITLLHREKEKEEESLSQLLKIQEDSKEEAAKIEADKGRYLALESYLPKIDSLGELMSAQQKYEQDKQKLEIEKERIEKIIKAYEIRINEAEIKLKDKDTLAKSIQEGKVTLQAIEYILECQGEKARKSAELITLRNQYKVIAQNLEKLKKEEMQLKVQYDEVTLAWMNGQASIMAEHLEEGKPCPVCGSTEHPHKAKSGQTLVNPEIMKKLETKRSTYIAEISKKEEEQNSILIRGKSLNEDITHLDKRINSYVEKINQSAEEITSTYKGQVEERLGANERKLQEIEKLTGMIEQDRSKVTLEMNTLEKIKEAIYTCQTQLELHKSRVEAIRSELPEGMATRDQLLAQMKALEEERKAFEARMQRLQDELEKVKVQLSKIIGMLEEKEKVLSDLKAKVIKAEESFNKALNEGQIEDLQTYEVLKLKVNELESLQEKIKEYYTQKAILEENKKVLEIKVADFRIEMLIEAKEHFEVLDKEKEKLQLEGADLERHIMLYEEVEQGIEALYEESKAVAKKQHIIGTMAQMAKGKNSKGLSFERYIQSSIFDEVLESANQKLRPMTTARYELYRTGDMKRKNAQSGLDIAVIDHYVGQTRPVSTLSGGESFMAALALALGLADVISRLAGASSLDTMFIDEGFGTLDEQSLELAIKTLLSLQDTGRLVGIISHVKELREQIPARLEITRTSKGSSAQFKL